MQPVAKSSRPLPELAFRTVILNNPYSARSMQRYARSLAQEYPEQSNLITDIAKAAHGLKAPKDRVGLRQQLVDLEYYLQFSR